MSPNEAELEALRAEIRSRPVMTDADREEQRRSFAYGNVALENPLVTRADIDRAAERLQKK